MLHLPDSLSLFSAQDLFIFCLYCNALSGFLIRLVRKLSNGFIPFPGAADVPAAEPFYLIIPKLTRLPRKAQLWKLKAAYFEAKWIPHREYRNANQAGILASGPHSIPRKAKAACKIFL